MKVEVNNLTSFVISDKQISSELNQIEKWYNQLTKKEKLSGFDLAVALVGKTRIKKANFQLRKKDQPTDVLSFCYEKKTGYREGELIICPEIIKKNAQSDRQPFEFEWRKNLIHGFLHIVGFEHSPEMFDLQAKILKKMK